MAHTDYGAGREIFPSECERNIGKATGYGQKDPTAYREGGLNDRLSSLNSLIGQLHEELNHLEQSLDALVMPRNVACMDKESPQPPTSRLTGAINDQVKMLAAACERVRNLRNGLDL